MIPNTAIKKCVKIEQIESELKALQDTIYVIGGKWKLPIIHLITRKVYPDAPVLVEYAFTEYANEYGILINEMVEWGKKHRKKLLVDKVLGGVEAKLNVVLLFFS